MDEKLNKAWHLAETEVEQVITEFELLLWRVSFGFERWQEDCEKYINQRELSASELSILHIIRMNERSKTVYDIARLLNREDQFNIQYVIKKLIKLGLVEKVVDPSKKVLSYQVTAEGVRDTNAYTKARRAILIDIYKKEASSLSLDKLSSVLAKLRAIYDEAAREVAYAKKI